MRVLLVVGLLLVAGWAVGAPTSTQMAGTQCYDCHAPGLWTPPMVEPKVSEYRFVPEGGGWFLEADVRNTWTHQMLNVSGILDTRHHRGVAVLPVGNGTAETFVGSFVASPLPAEDSRSHSIEAPVGTQTLHAALRSGGIFPHDLHLEVYPPGQSEPCPGVVAQGAGREDTVVFGQEDLAAFGPGEWTFVVRKGASFEEIPEDVPYTLDVAFDTSVQEAALATGGDAGPDEAVTLRWPVALAENGRAPLALAIRYTSYYEHIGGEPDTEYLHTMTSVEVTTLDGRPQFIEVEKEDVQDASIPGWPVASLLAALAAVVVARRS